MFAQDLKQQWQLLHNKWVTANKHAEQLERELMSALRQCLEKKAEPPGSRLLCALERARGEAGVCRLAADLFVDRLFVEHSLRQ